MQPTTTSVVPPRGRGRPRRLTPDAVLDAALALFEDEPAAEFTLARLARRLDAPITSLYTYFPNRDALLDAASERVFARFAWSAQEGDDWQAVLLSWMHAVQRHFAQYPIAQKLLAWDRHISPAWLRVLAPMVSLLYARGLRGARLTRTFSWFINGTVGLIDAHAYTSRLGARLVPGALEWSGMDALARKAQLELWSHVHALDHADALDTGFRVLVAGVAAALPPARR